MKIQFRSILGLLFGLCCLGNVANADYVLVTEVFTGRIQAFDVNTKAETTFATVDSGSFLSGLAFNAANNTVYASALQGNRIYRFNATTGQQLGFIETAAPGGITVGPDGNVYVLTDSSDGKLLRVEPIERS